MNFVFLYDPLAVGKLTVAQELVHLTGYRLYHNHIVIDVARPVFDFGTPAFWRLVQELRNVTLAHAAEEEVDMIGTGVYWQREGEPSDWAPCFEAVERNGGHVCLVQLLCDPIVQARRLQAAGRRELNKLVSVEGLKELMTTRDLLSRIPGRDSLTLDTTDLAPGEAAFQIATHYGLPRGSE